MTSAKEKAIEYLLIQKFCKKIWTLDIIRRALDMAIKEAKKEEQQRIIKILKAARVCECRDKFVCVVCEHIHGVYE